jgi:acetate CoA/acetoacetate CoA-transferase beta subunit
MQHMAKGQPKIVNTCTLPITSARPVDCVVTELALIRFASGNAVLAEIAPGVSVDEVMAATEAELVVSDDLCEMQL